MNYRIESFHQHIRDGVRQYGAFSCNGLKFTVAQPGGRILSEAIPEGHPLLTENAFSVDGFRLVREEPPYDHVSDLGNEASLPIVYNDDLVEQTDASIFVTDDDQDGKKESDDDQDGNKESDDDQDGNKESDNQDNQTTGNPEDLPTPDEIATLDNLPVKRLRVIASAVGVHSPSNYGKIELVAAIRTLLPLLEPKAPTETDGQTEGANDAPQE